MATVLRIIFAMVMVMPLSAFGLDIIKGCTDNNAVNFKAVATADDGSCAYTAAWCAAQMKKLDDRGKCQPASPDSAAGSDSGKKPEAAPQQAEPKKAPHRKKTPVKPKVKNAVEVKAAEQHEPEGEWAKWGIAPYASSLEDACKKASVAIEAFSMPDAVRSHFIREVGKTCEGRETWLTPHQRLEEMWSGGSHPHIMKGRTVAELPVTMSPDGRPYRKGSVAEAAKTRSWAYVYDGKTYQLYLPLVCGNWSWAYGEPPRVVERKSPLQLEPIVGACPDVYTLKVNVWKYEALSLEGVERTHAGEELEEKFAYVPHVSREHGAQFRRAYKNGMIGRSKTPHAFRVSLIMTPEARGGAPDIAKESILGDISVTGLYELRFTKAQLEQWDAIRLVPIADGGIVSPPRYHLTGLHELRFFNHLPRTQLGEWDANPVPDCIMNAHFVESPDKVLKALFKMMGMQDGND